MPHHISDDSEPGGVVISFSGVVSGSELIELNDRLASDESYLRCRYQVWDFSKAIRLDVETEDLRSISVRDMAASAVNPHVKIAIVGQPSLFGGRDRVFQIFEEAWTSYAPRIFRDLETAMEWAASSENAA